MMAAALGGIPLLLVVSLLLTSGAPPPSDDAPPFYALILRNGFFASLAALGAVQVFLLPLSASLLTGDAIAGEASLGTLRYLLSRPVGRSRLLLAKYAAAVTIIVALVACVLVSGLLFGGIAYGLGPLPTVSGSTLEAGTAAVRLAGAGLYVVTGMAALGAVGLFASTVTDSAPGATVVTVGFAIVSQIVDALSALRLVHPFLISHRWLAFVDLFRSPVDLSNLGRGLIVHAGYTVLFLGAAIYVFSRKDVMT